MFSPENYTSWQLIRDIYAWIRPYRQKFWWGVFLRFTSDLVWLYPAYALASLVNFFSEYAPGDSIEVVWMTLGFWVIASLIHFIGHDSAKYLIYQVGENAALDASLRTIRHLFSLDLAWHERENTGNKLKRIQKGGEGITNILRMVANNIVEISVNFFGMIFIIAFLDLKIALTVLVFLVIYFSISVRLTKKAAAASHLVNVEEEKLQGLAFEALNNIQTVTVLKMKEPLSRLLQKLIKNLVQKIKNRIFSFRSRAAVLNLCGQIFRLLVLGFAIRGIVAGQYEVGFLVLVYGYFDKIWQSVAELSDVASEFVIAKYGIHRMMEILHEPVQIEDERGKVNFSKNWRKIGVADLSFAYGKNTVLKKISFDIKRGEKIGVVGLSGGGKSTLFKLFLKQREEYSGEIRFDEIPLKRIKKSDYLNHVAVVLQETELFNMSLKDNILIASPTHEYHPQKFKRALEISHVYDFLPKLPQGADTLIGEKGVKLSGGEKQRLGIARAVYKEPTVLFLDEATSHLDIESEQKIQDSLHRFFQDITAVVIAHRLSTIREMDRIIVLEKGRIVESGSFQTLLKKKGRFYELWQKQQFI